MSVLDVRERYLDTETGAKSKLFGRLRCECGRRHVVGPADIEPAQKVKAGKSRMLYCGG